MDRHILVFLCACGDHPVLLLLGEVSLHRPYEEPQVIGLVFEVGQQHLRLLFGDEFPHVEPHGPVPLGLLAGEALLQALPALLEFVCLVAALELFAHALKHFAGVREESPHVGPDELLQPLSVYVRAGAVHPLVIDGCPPPAAVVVIALAGPGTGGGSTPVGPAATGTLDEPREEIVAVRPPSGEALVLLQAHKRLVAKRRLHYGRDLTFDLLSALYLHHVRARVCPLLDHFPHGCVAPGGSVLARLASVAVPGRGLTLVVKALRLRVEGGAAGDVGDYLPHYAGLLLHDHEGAVGRYVVAVGDSSHVPAAPVSPVEPCPGPLPDGLALVLCKRGEHLEDEPSRWVGGVYWLGGAPQRYAGGLEPVVGVHDDEQRAAQPVEPVDEHRVELALFSVL